MRVYVCMCVCVCVCACVCVGVGVGVCWGVFCAYVFICIRSKPVCIEPGLNYIHLIFHNQQTIGWIW